MIRFLKSLLLGLVLLVGSAVAILYLLSGRAIHRRYDVASVPFTTALPTDSVSLAEGERIAWTRGCFGCHGEELRGAAFIDEPMLARLIAPNLTKIVRRYTPAEFERVLRHAVRPDGRSVFVMPSDMYRSLTDGDVAKLIAFVASQPEREGEERLTSIRPMGRLGIVLGEFPSARELIETETPLPAPADTALAMGHYVAITSCVECHGPDLRGLDDSPSLPAVITAYTPDEFAGFLTSGVAKGGRELPLMSRVARNRLARLTDAEVRSLHAYLSSLGALPHEWSR